MAVACTASEFIPDKSFTATIRAPNADDMLKPGSFES